MAWQVKARAPFVTQQACLVGCGSSGFCRARRLGPSETRPVKYKDRGVPAQLGNAELGWSQGGYSHRRGAGRRMPVTAREYGACGTGRTLGVAWVSFGFNLLETNDAIQCTLALDTTVVRMAVTVQLLEREVDRGEARFLDGSRGWG
jgi:hypothetical protein